MGRDGGLKVDAMETSESSWNQAGSKLPLSLQVVLLARTTSRPSSPHGWMSFAHGDGSWLFAASHGHQSGKCAHLAGTDDGVFARSCPRPAVGTMLLRRASSGLTVNCQNHCGMRVLPCCSHLGWPHLSENKKEVFDSFSQVLMK